MTGHSLPSDSVPTLVTAAGVQQTPGTMQGQSLWKHITGDKTAEAISGWAYSGAVSRNPGPTLLQASETLSEDEIERLRALGRLEEE